MCCEEMCSVAAIFQRGIKTRMTTHAGRQILELSVYAFLCVAAVASVLVIFALLYAKSGHFGHVFQIIKQCQRYVCLDRVDAGTEYSSLTKIKAFSDEICIASRLFIIVFAIHAVSCLPLYAMKLYEYGVTDGTYSTHAYQYLWILSTAYVKGNVAALLLIVLWLPVVASMFVFVVRHNLNGHDAVSETKSISSSTKEDLSSEHSTSYVVAKFCAVLTLNVLITGTVNGIYIYYTNQSISPSVYLGMQVAVALFKVGWNMVAVPLLARPMHSPSNIVFMEVLMSVFNNIYIPCMIATFTSPSCFQVWDVLLVVTITVMMVLLFVSGSAC